MRISLIVFALLVLGNSPLYSLDIYEAIDSGRVAQVESILGQNPELLNARNAGGMTPLNWAAYRGQSEIVQKLLALGADASIGDNENSQPFHNAAVAAHTDVMELLLASGVDINVTDDNGMTALHFAISFRHPEVADWLIEKGIDPLAANNNGLTPLHYSALRGFPDLIDRLVTRGADINVRTRAGSTPLLHASGYNQTEAALKLLELGADTELANEYGRTPLLNVARESGNADMARILVDHGADINAVDVFGDTPIILAAWRGFSAIVNLLLDHNAEVPVTGDTAVRLVRNAAERGLDRLMSLMVTRGVDLSIGSRHGGSLLHAAAMGGSAGIVSLLLEQGLTVNEADVFGWTPLHYASGKGRYAAAEILIEHGADVNARTLAGHSPFSLAEAKGRTEIMDLLVTAGADQGPQTFPEHTGPYFGMTPPGDTPELFAPDIVSTNWGGHSSVAFSPDGSDAFWNAYFMPSDSGYGYSRMLSSRIAAGHWSVPQAPDFAITEGGDDVPFFSQDGSKLYFISRRPLRPGGQSSKENIWVVDRTAGGWGDPYPVPGEVNSISMHWQFSVANSGTIYFAGDGPDQLGRGDIYRSMLVDGEYTTPENLGDLINTPADETCPLVARDEEYLIFTSSGHQSADNRLEICISWKKSDGSWTKPVSTGLIGLCPMLSPDGKYLFYRGEVGDIFGVYWLRADFIDRLKPADL